MGLLSYSKLGFVSPTWQPLSLLVLPVCHPLRVSRMSKRGTKRSAASRGKGDVDAAGGVSPSPARRRRRREDPPHSDSSNPLDGFADHASQRVPYPSPGEVIYTDQYATERKDLPSSSSLRVMTFNIERGYKVAAIIDMLSNVQPDILLLQEVDIGCARTKGKDIGAAIAEALGYHYMFVCEYRELYSPKRAERLQGGGVSGNAILSKFPITHMEGKLHTYQAWDWSKGRIASGQPRTGGRVWGRCVVQSPVGALLAYTLHLENFSGPLGRVRQFLDVLEDREAFVASDQGRALALKGHIVGGDLNTLTHGVLRWLPMHVDQTTWWNALGITEAQWWEENVFHPPQGRSLPVCGDDDSARRSLRVPRDLSDPFDKTRAPTIIRDVPLGLFTYYQAKIDWLLFTHETIRVERTRVAGKGLSDHLYCMADVRVAAKRRCGSRADSQ